MTTLVDAFAIPAEWKAAQILEEEAERQEAMAARDAEVRAEAEGDSPRARARPTWRSPPPSSAGAAFRSLHAAARQRRGRAEPAEGGRSGRGQGESAPVEILAAAEALRVPAAVDLAAIVIGALTGGLLAAREGFAVSGVLLLAVSGGLGGGLIRDVLLGEVPPVALTNPAYLPTVAITAAVTFFFSGWLSRLTGCWSCSTRSRWASSR